jgi:hypothetical protein
MPDGPKASNPGDSKLRLSMDGFVVRNDGPWPS